MMSSSSFLNIFSESKACVAIRNSQAFGVQHAVRGERKNNQKVSSSAAQRRGAGAGAARESVARVS